jgi:hypothetical protein
MNKLLKINANGLLVEFLERYKIWQDYCNLNTIIDQEYKQFEKTIQQLL